MGENLTGWMRRHEKAIPVFITAISLGLMLIIYSQTSTRYNAFLMAEKRSEVEAILAPNGDNLNNALHRRFSLISGLNAYIQSYLTIEDTFTAEEFSHFSQGLYASLSGTRRILVAPRGIVALEYPFSGKDSLIGIDQLRFSSPLTNDPYTRSIDLKKIIVAGPYKLDHAHIFVTAHEAVFDKNGLWGLIAFEYDLIQIMSESNLTLAQNDLAWGLYDENEEFFFGDPDISEKDPVAYRIGLPEGNWYLKAAPHDGWEKAIEGDKTVFRNVSLVIIFLVTALIYLLISQQTRLTSMVRVRTAALQDELTLRTMTEDLLKVNEEKFRGVFNQMSDMAILYHLVAGNLPGAILEVNDAACSLLGFPREELLKLSLIDLELSENRVRLIQRTKETAPLGQGFFETELLKKNGEALPVETRVKHFRMQDSEVGLIIARDISERRTAEKNLQRANRALKVLIEFNESLVRAGSEKELLEVLCNILVNTGQYDLAWAGFIDHESQQMVTRIIQRSEKALHLTIPENKLISSLPSVTENSVSLPLTIGEEMIGSLGIVLSGSNKFSYEEINLLNKLADDISYGVSTLRTRAEALKNAEQLRESEALYHELARNIPNGVVMLFDKNRRHLLVDGLGLAELGLTPEAAAGRTLEEIFPADIHDALNSQYEATLAGRTITQEIVIEDRVYETHSSPIRKNNGDVTMGLNLIQDITEHKNLQATIKHQQEEQQMILDSIPAMVFFKTRDGRITWANKPFRDRLGLPLSEFLNRYDYELLPHLKPEYLALGEKELFETLEPQRNIIGYFEMENGPIWLTTDKIPNIDKDGMVDGLIGFTFDITALKRAELEVTKLNTELENRVARRTAELEEKNRELETFSFSVSHDLKAPLRGIAGYSQLLMENYARQLDKEGMDFLFIIRDSVQRMEQLINDLLSYSRMERRALNSRKVDLRELIQFVVAEYRDEIQTRGIVVKESFSFHHLYSDGEALAQIFRNLIGNAVKFTRYQESPVISIKGIETPDAWVLSIQDNGIGMDKVHHEKIFEIFQRLQSSEDFPGTGVGLAIVRKVVTRLGGRVWVESEKGKGATFYVELQKDGYIDL